jgi:acyl dehydratase
MSCWRCVTSSSSAVVHDGGLTANPNDLALMLNLTIPLVIALFLAAERWAAKALLGGILALAVVAVVVTFSRSGFLTLALIPRVLPEVLDVRGFTMGVNYGLDKVRFPAPVPVGGRIRATLVLEEVTDVPGGVQLAHTITFEVEGQDKPACVARFLERRFE